MALDQRYALPVAGINPVTGYKATANVAGSGQRPSPQQQKAMDDAQAAAEKKAAAEDAKKQAQLADAKENGGIDPYTGKPVAAAYQSVLDKHGNLAKQYRLDEKTAQIDPKKLALLDINNLQPNKDAYNAIKDRAMTTGPSPWMNMQLQKAELDKQDAIGQNQRQTAGDVATAESGLAMRGGMGSGSRERIARSGLSMNNLANQNVYRTAANNNVNLGIADENQKLDLLKTIPGMDLAGAQYTAGLNQSNNATKNAATQYNAGVDMDAQKFNALGGISGKSGVNAYNSNVYNQNMAGWGAGMSADAIANQKNPGLFGSGGILGTGIGGNK
jgi:hypothetical protein